MRHPGIGIGPSLLATLVTAMVGGSATATAEDAKAKVGERVERVGDEIVACGQLFHTTAPVKLWTDPGGYDAYRLDHRFGPVVETPRGQEEKTPEPLRRFGPRRVELTPEQKEQVRGGGWDLKLLQEKVDQFVIHFDVCGSSQTCFKVLHDDRGLSVQFLLDLDGTIYQTPGPEGTAPGTPRKAKRSLGRHRDRQPRRLSRPATSSPRGSNGRWYVKDAARQGPTDQAAGPQERPQALRHPDMILSPDSPRAR